MSYFAEINENNDKVTTDKKITWYIATEPLKSKCQGLVPKAQGSIKKGKDWRIITVACGWWRYDKTKLILVSF